MADQPTGSRASPKNTLLALFVAATVGVGAAGVYMADKLYLAPLREKDRLLAERQVTITNFKKLVDGMTKDQRVAEIFVTDQTENPLKTTFNFVEVDESGKPVTQPKSFTIDGDIAYFDALVIKFQDNFKMLEKDAKLEEEEVQRALANKSIIFFRRVFSDKQKPENGFALDDPGRPPAPYTAGLDEKVMEQKWWNDFWELANNPKLAADRGVRAAHGQAAYTKLRKHQTYVLERRLTGDLTLRPKDSPAVKP